MMKAGFFLAGLVLFVVGASSCDVDQRDSIEYEQVTIGELVGNTTAYDLRNVSVNGTYVDMPMYDLHPAVICWRQCDTYQLIEEYSEYRCYFWGISDGHDTIALCPLSDRDKYPHLEEGQEIEIRGTAHATTIVVGWCSCRKLRSLYITVDARDIIVKN